MLLYWCSSMKKKLRKTPMIFDIVNLLWKSKFGTFDTSPSKHLPNFVPPPSWKIDNPYYHNCRHCYDVHKGRCNYTLVNGIKTFCCDECGKTFKVSFQGIDTKLEKFLAQNVKCVVKKCLNLAFVNFLCQKSSESSFFLTFLIF